MLPPKEVSSALHTLLKEQRVFPPPATFAERARIPDLATYQALRERAAQDPDGFWGGLAQELLVWRKPFSKVRQGTLPDVEWFVDGELNATETCLDRHLGTWRRNKAAIIWEGEPGDRQVWTYLELATEVGRLAGALRARGVKRGDRVCIYMPMVPQAAVAMLACARLGAPHSVVFAGFSAEALRDRIRDAGAQVVITADGTYRKGVALPLKTAVDQAVAANPSVHTVVVLERTGADVAWDPRRDVRWDEIVEQAQPAEAVAVPSNHPLFLLYTSGSTGSPKGMVHTTGGYLTGVASSMDWVFDLRDDDTFWCTADVGWVTGHSYSVYGPLARGATCFMYEGAPLHPNPDRFWEMVARHHVTVLYTAPTAIRRYEYISME